MITVLLCAAMVSPTATRPQQLSISPDNYLYSLVFKTPDISRNETGMLKNAGTPEEEWEVRGDFSWIDPDGASHRTNFLANKDGYQPTQVEPAIMTRIGPGLSVRSALAG